MDQAPEYGFFLLQLTRSAGRVPLAGARVEASDSAGQRYAAITDNAGEARFTLPAPPFYLSQVPSATRVPYALYDIQVTMEGFVTALFKGVQIFSSVTSEQSYQMLRRTEMPRKRMDVIIISPQPLSTPGGRARPRSGNDGPGRGPLPAVAPVSKPVIVPENITVHLGAPTQSARDVTVPFLYYIKNVASSEIYPTWPETALRANMHAQISLALNRIYTEWYRTQGYDFDITSSPAYDQYFIDQRSTFDSVNLIADRIFTTYVARAGGLEPVFTEYCDGVQSQCPGLSQWGTVELANKYYTPLDILRYYYGDDIYYKEASVAETVPDSFPGALESGAESASVATLQNRLNRIAINYPAIPFIEVPNGNYGETTMSAVRAFQQAFGLPANGNVNEATWYRILYVYNAVKKLAELGSEGEKIENDGYPGFVLNVGDRSLSTLRMQVYLNRISEFLGSQAVPAPTIDGRYGSGMRASVIAFQRQNGLPQTGTIDRATWDRIVTVYYDIPGDLTPQTLPYPGTPIRQGDTGQIVRFIQNVLNTIGDEVSSIPKLEVDGVFGSRTTAAVKAFQTYFGLAADGIVGPRTWQKMTDVYSGKDGVG